MRFIATCKMGLESVVSYELRSLGIQTDGAEDARVPFTGDFSAMARACLWLRSAERVLFVVDSFPAQSFEELFQGVKGTDWKPYLTPNTQIHVNGKSAKSVLFSVSDCQSIAKKAIVESLKAAYHTQIIPENGPEIIVEVGVLKNQVTLALDCCGAGLSRRGYRTYNVAAPISETLGAALVQLSRFKGEQPFIDPMCGSGTMPIEAAMIARNMAPGANRPFAAEQWHFLPQAVFQAAREEAADSLRDVSLNILGSDIDPRSIDLCKKHAKKAGVMVNWAVRPVSELAATGSGGVILCNPPYGERMLERKEAEALYKPMRTAFDALPEWSKHIISSHPEFEKVYGKRADKRRNLSNGGMRCTLYQYFVKG